MEEKEFIEEQLKMLEDDFSKSQIMDNVYRYIFKRGINIFKLEALINQCMEFYAEIMIRHKQLN